MDGNIALLPFHPLANLFPFIEGDAFADLVADVRENGVREPIVLLDGQILDGRNRYRAGLAAGFFTPSPEGSAIPHPQYMFDHFNGERDGDPLKWVLSKNLNRRHLTDDQRRMVAARVANLGRGQSAGNLSNGGISRQAAADLLSIDVQGLDRAKTVITHGSDELQHAVDERRVTVRMAADLAALPTEQQKDILADADPEALKTAVRNLRASIGTKTATNEERGANLYETPVEAMRMLLALESFSGVVWEPSCGRGAISRVLEAAGYDVILSDLIDYKTCDQYGEVQAIGDFLATETAPATDIVTNPPYGQYLNAYMAHALRVHKPEKMALLLNINAWFGTEDGDRTAAMSEFPPSRIYGFARRLPMMHRDGYEGPIASSSINHAWFVWERNADGSYGNKTKLWGDERADGPKLYRFDWKDFQDSEPVSPGSASIAPRTIVFGERPEEDLTRSTPCKTDDERVLEERAGALAWMAGRGDFTLKDFRNGYALRGRVAEKIIETFEIEGLLKRDGEVFGLADRGQEVAKPTASADAMPLAPWAGEAVTIDVGDMRKASASVTIHHNADGQFSISSRYDLPNFGGGSSPARDSFPSFEEALVRGLTVMQCRLDEVENSANSCLKKPNRVAAKAGSAWIERHARAWGLIHSTDEVSK